PGCRHVSPPDPEEACFQPDDKAPSCCPSALSPRTEPSSRNPCWTRLSPETRRSPHPKNKGSHPPPAARRQQTPAGLQQPTQPKRQSVSCSASKFLEQDHNKSADTNRTSP